MAGPRRRPHLDPGGQVIEPPPDAVEAMAAAAHRFDSAIAGIDRLPARRADVEILRLLREAPIAGIGRVVYSSNAVFLAELEAPDPLVSAEPMRAIYKPRRGERPLWDFPRHSLHLREVACYGLDAALGFALVPPTTLRDGPHGPGSMQLFINPGEHDGDRAGIEARLHAVATLDVIANNADRKRAHLLAGADGGIWAIDNALTFLPYPRQRTVLLDLGGSPLPDDCAVAVSNLNNDAGRRGDLLAGLGLLLDPAEVAATGERLKELGTDPVYPVLDNWDGRPWDGW